MLTHISKKTKAFVATLGSRLKLFYLPAYPPDRDPDELVWKHLKADTVGGMATTSKADFKSKVVSSMRSLQKTPEKNPLLLSEAFSSIRGVNVGLFMDRLNRAASCCKGAPVVHRGRS
jgi:hypothetical protein